MFSGKRWIFSIKSTDIADMLALRLVQPVFCISIARVKWSANFYRITQVIFDILMPIPAALVQILICVSLVQKSFKNINQIEVSRFE